jgi:hypothetical protein
MTTARTFLTVGCVAAGLAITACGGDDSKDTAAPATTEASTTESTTATTGATGTTGATDPNAPKLLPGTTPPGTTLKVGSTAKVQMTPLTADFSETKDRFQLELTVEDIKKASASDFKGIDLDEKQKKATPYFVTAKLANKSDKTNPVKNDDPDVRISAVDDREQEQNSVIFIGDFPACNDEGPPKPFGTGKDYETCMVFMIPGGGTLKGVTWGSGIEYVDKPITWAFDG